MGHWPSALTGEEHPSGAKALVIFCWLCGTALAVPWSFYICLDDSLLNQLGK
jgi:hypothetical protein